MARNLFYVLSLRRRLGGGLHNRLLRSKPRRPWRSRVQRSCKLPAKARPGPHAGHVATATTHGICVLVPVGDSGVSGVVNFCQRRRWSSCERGGHWPDSWQTCISCPRFRRPYGPRRGQIGRRHYNPTGHPHGRPEDTQRHIGGLRQYRGGRQRTCEDGLHGPP